MNPKIKSWTAPSALSAAIRETLSFYRPVSPGYATQAALTIIPVDRIETALKHAPIMQPSGLAQRGQCRKQLWTACACGRVLCANAAIIYRCALLKNASVFKQVARLSLHWPEKNINMHEAKTLNRHYFLLFHTISDTSNSFSNCTRSVSL